MKTILVDDELWMLQQFADECTDIVDIQLVGKFRNPIKALEFAKKERVDLAFLDIEMPEMNGLQLAAEMKKIYPEMIVIFVSAYDSYMADAFKSRNADYYILKPYKKEDVEEAIERAKLLSGRLKKRVYIHTFGRFAVYVDGKPLKIDSPKARELLAILVDKGREPLGNEEAFYMLWEDRIYDHAQASSFYKVLKRLKTSLDAVGICNILESLPHAQVLRTELVDCDYYQLLEKKPRAVQSYNGEYMSEYSWGETTNAKLMEITGFVSPIEE